MREEKGVGGKRVMNEFKCKVGQGIKGPYVTKERKKVSGGE